MTTCEEWIEGRAWVFDEANLNTDVMMPPSGRYVSKRERALLAFASIRPGWASMVEEGDIIVAGRNFGTGSSRPAAEVFHELGIRAILAESINGLFFRNCINYALPPFEYEGILANVSEQDILALNPVTGVLVNKTKNITLQGSGIPPSLMEIIQAGGLLSQLRQNGFLPSPP